MPGKVVNMAQGASAPTVAQAAQATADKPPAAPDKKVEVIEIAPEAVTGEVQKPTVHFVIPLDTGASYDALTSSRQGDHFLAPAYFRATEKR